MSDVKSITNKILEGADLRGILKEATGEKVYKLLTGENPLALADGMKPDGLTVTATPKWLSAP